MWPTVAWAVTFALAIGALAPLSSKEAIAGDGVRDGDAVPVHGSAGPSPDTASIRPGILILNNGIPADAGCTANFVFQSATNGTLYLGAAHHCLEGLPIGAPVEIGRVAIGRFAFSLPAALGLRSEDLHYGEHDFALVEIPSAFVGSTSPAVLGYGGPLGIQDGSEYAEGDLLLAWANSSYRPAVHKLRGVIYNTTYDFFLWVVMPGLVFGDSGSPVLSPEGHAVGFVKGIDLVLRLDYVLARTNEVGFSVELLTHDSWNPSPL